MDELLSPGGLEDEEEEAFDFIDQEPDSEETRKRQLDLDDEDLVRKLQDELSSLNSSELRESSVDSNGRRLDPGEKEMRFSRKVIADAYCRLLMALVFGAWGSMHA